jgi:hypothetical protein
MSPQKQTAETVYGIVCVFLTEAASLNPDSFFRFSTLRALADDGINRDAEALDDDNLDQLQKPG